MISLTIPCYDMAGRGVEMLRELMASIRMQTFTDYEIVVSCNDDYLVAAIPIDYIFGVHWATGRTGAAANLNNAIDHAKGDIIKPMFQDDKFIEPNSLQKIADAMEHAEWIACTSHNKGLENYDHVPYVHKSLQRLREGENTYGCPSAMAWRRNDLRFDENLAWLFDCEFYARMCEKYGTPKFVDTPIFIRQWEGQATRALADGSQRIRDHNYVVEQYR
jgi:glycosyltransferase involved in cell wall biosynthesis